MKFHRLVQLPVLGLLACASPAAIAQEGWLARCSQQLADSGKPESGKYLLQTRGKSDGAEARAEMDYSSGVSARAVVYPTDAKDFLNPYSNISFSLGYVVPAGGKDQPSLGHVSMSAIGKDFAPIAGAPIKLKLTIDGRTFGPWETKPVSSGMYSLWPDTEATDGDSKPPVLKPADFGKLEAAIKSMKTVEIALVREDKDIATASVPFPQLVAWRDGLAAWGARIRPGSCGGGEILN